MSIVKNDSFKNFETNKNLFLQSYANFTNIFVPRCDLKENLLKFGCKADNIEDPRSDILKAGLFYKMI